MKLSFDLSYNTTPKLVINPGELLQNYLYGVPICNSQGLELTSDIIEKKILIAQQWLEGILYIKLNEQIIRETSNFVKNEWDQWGFVKCTYNVKYALQLEGYFNTIKQIGYPFNWLNIRSEKSSLTYDEDHIFRNIYIVPSGATGNPQSGGVTFNGTTPFVLFQGLGYIPNYWVSTYITGFQKTPMMLVDMVAKLATIQLLAMLGTVFGGVGMQNYSISLDGLSQNTSLIKSGTYGVYGSLISQFMNDLYGTGGQEGMLAAAKARYRAVTMDVC